MTAPETEKPAAKCPVEMHDGKPCGRASYDDEGRCICHSEKPDKDAATFERQVQSMLAGQVYDFSHFVFPQDAQFAQMVAELPTYFVGVRFIGKADFLASKFQRNVDFRFATFHDEVELSGTEFAANALFGAAAFLRKASFHGTKFNGEADFWGTTFEGDTTFRYARFRSSARFAGINDTRVFSGHGETDFRNGRFAQADEVVFEHIFLGRARFLGSDVRRVDFTDVEWARRPLWGPRWRPLVERQDKLGRGIRWVCRKWPAWLKPRGRFAVWDELGPEQWEPKDYALIGKLYRQLKHNYEEQRDPITAGDFHFGEMEMRRLEPCKGWLRTTYRRYLSAIALYRWISGYGEDYVRAGAWIVGVILLFAALFTFPCFALQTTPSSGPPQPANGFWPHLFHSVVSNVLYSAMCFFLRSDKPFQPANVAGRYVSLAEGIVGPALIALFILALNRRFKR